MIGRSILAALIGVVLLTSQATAQTPPDVRTQEALKRSGDIIWFYGSSMIPMASRLLHEGEFVRAIRVTETALEFNLQRADRWVALNILCIAYVRANAALLAIPYCDDAVDMGIENWQTYNNRANAYLTLSRYDQAIKDYETALDLAIKQEEARKTAAEAGEEGEDASTAPLPPVSGGPLGIIPENEVENPVPIARENLELAKKMAASARRF